MARTNVHRASRAAFRIAAVYAVVGLAWVGLSDVGLLQVGPEEDRWELGLLKGLAFVIVTAALLFLLIRREVAQRQSVTALLQAVLDAAPLGIAYLRTDGRIAHWNAAAAQLLGVPASEAIGRTMAEAGLQLPEPPAAVTDTTLTTRNGDPLQARVFRRNGADGNGEVLLFYDRSRDVDSEKAQRQLQKLHAIGRLAGGVAHDFNNLLTAVLGHAVLLADALPNDDPRQDHVEEIRRAALRGAGVTRQLLVVSGRSVSRPEVLPIGDVIRELEPALVRTAGAGIRLELRIEPDCWHVQCDAGQFEQILLNLVVNAREAMPDGGAIVIEGRNVTIGADAADGLHRGEFVRIAVRDTGRGMDPETQIHLFEPFFTTKHQGTGLGLATVYGVIQQYDGHVRVRSQPGTGSEFELFFPRALLPEPPAAGADTAAGVAATLLVVEDDDLVRDLTCRLLRRGGHDVLAARDGAEALDIAAQRPDIQLVVADIVMPGINGVDLSRRLRAQRPDLPILLTSGYTAGSLLDEGELDEDTHFLAKPYRPEELLTRVRELLASTAR